MANLPSIQIYHPGFTPTERHPWHKRNPSRGCGQPSRRVAPLASPRPHNQHHHLAAAVMDKFDALLIPGQHPALSRTDGHPPDRDSRPAARSGSASKPLLLSPQLQSCPSAAEPRSRAECETQTQTRKHAGEGLLFTMGPGDGHTVAAPRISSGFGVCQDLKRPVADRAAFSSPRPRASAPLRTRSSRRSRAWCR